MIVDAHTHYRFPRFLENPQAYLETEPFAAYCASNPKHRELAIDEIVEAADWAGVTRVALQGSGFVSHETCVELNDYGLEGRARYPHRLLVFACIQPKAGKDALKELRRCIDGGMVGVGELNPDGQGFTLDDPDFCAVAEAAVDMDVPLLLHVNETVGHHYPGKGKVPLADLYQFVLKFPRLKLIAAHWGGGLLFYELMPEVREACINVYYDTAASPLLYRASVFPISVQLVGSKKILFGTDFPLICFPREQEDPDFGFFIQHVRESGLDAESLDDILGRNAARLFGL